MTVLNYGSLNIDHVYRVPHFVRPGETLTSLEYRRFAGGKGLNQSIALARAGAPVHHAGKIGPEGRWLRDILAQEGVDTRFVQETDDVPTGHAIIQVVPEGENAIVIYGGANRAITPEDIHAILDRFGPEDWLLLQNEISGLAELLARAGARGLRIALNPAPMTPQVMESPLEHVDLFIVNETEGAALTGEQEPQAILAAMRRRFPRAATVLTLGARGSLYEDDREHIHTPAVPVQAVDTTAAGDTFTGYLLAGLLEELPPARALELATRAAALCVTRPGAAPSIPHRAEVDTFSGTSQRPKRNRNRDRNAV